MKINRTVVLSTFVLFFSVLTPSLAIAENKNSNSPSPAEVRKDFKSAMQEFKQDQKTFLENLKAYEAARRAINRAFKKSVDKALSDAKSLSAPGQTQLQKHRSEVAKQGAVIKATALREAAIKALGPAPVAPTPPAKTPRMEKSKKSVSPTPSAN